MSPTSSNNSTMNSPLPGYLGNLTVKEVDMLKQMWTRLFKLFKQKGTEFKPQAEAAVEEKKGGWFGNKKESNKEIFIGATTDPQWLTLPLEKALPLIPGIQLQTTFWNMVNTDNPDAVCLRFLRARKWDIDAAYNMLANTLRWRLVMRVDDIISLGENGLRDELNRLKSGYGDCFIKQLNSGKSYLGGPDKDGRGICFINVKLHYKEDQPHEVIKLLTMYIMETSRVIVHQPVETCCIVFNMDSFTLKNMDFDFVKFLVSCFEAYYPETLGALYIHRAPWVFSTVWTLIQPLLDPVVATKIHFTKDFNDLNKYIEKSALPGNITGEKGKMTIDEAVKVAPVPSGKLQRPDTPSVREYLEFVKEYESETVEWTKEKSVAQEGKDAGRQELAKQYRLARIKAERDMRGPTGYQAKGLIRFTEENRVMLDFGSDGWVPLDITDMV